MASKAFRLLPYIVFLIIAQTPWLHAQSGGNAPAQKALTASQLQDLVSPIALYPDPLLGQMLPAATFPDQIVDAALLIKTAQDAKNAEQQAWDASVKALANYPGVLKMMYEKLNWTTALGTAFLNQHKQLLDAIQQLRTKAQKVGNLKSSEQQKVDTVVTDQGTTVITVQPANPQVIYVPQTTTEVVYTQPQPKTDLTPLLTFGLGVAVGAAVADDDDDDVYYYGGGYYRGPAMWTSNSAYNDWYDRRNDQIEHHQDMRENRLDSRIDRMDNRQGFRQDMISENPAAAKNYYNQKADNVQARRDTTGQTATAQNATTRRDTASQNAATRRDTASQNATARQQHYQSSSNYQNRQAQASSREQQRQAAQQDLQARQQSGSLGSTHSSSQWGSSRGYGASTTSSNSAFSGAQSGSRATAYSDRGASSRNYGTQNSSWGSGSKSGSWGSSGSRSGSYGGGSRSYSSPSRSSYGGGARRGGGRSGGGGGRRR